MFQISGAIEQTGQFKRDYKLEAKSPHRQTLASDFIAIITASGRSFARAFAVA